MRTGLKHQLPFTPNFFQRFNPDVSLPETDTYPRAMDPISLAETEYRIAGTSQHEEKFGHFGRMTGHLDLRFGVRNINQKTISTPRPVDSHHSDLKRLLESNATFVVFGFVDSHHHRLSDSTRPVAYPAKIKSS